jgi:ABC-type bacteriocin/lantibiotic exporter with double-glycine peptidase domain
MLPLLYFNARYFHPRILKLTESVRKDESKLLEHFMDKFSRVKLIKIFNNYDYEIEKLTLKINKLISTNLKFQLLSSKTGSFSTFLMSTSPVLILLFGGNDVIKGTMTTGGLIAFIQYQNKIFGPFRDLMSLYTDAIKASVSMRRLFTYFDIEKEVTGTLKLEQNELKRYGVSFKNVSFKRGNKFVLDELSLKFDLGKSYALVGRSGCGKSTLIDLICGFETTNIGEINIGNINLLDINKASLREHISLVNQDGLLFKDTIRDNILYGNLETNKDDFNSAVSVSRINFLEKSLCIEKTSVDENESVKLSGGQIQKVGIARTILKKPEILILDESTSALDSENEKKIIDNLSKLYREKTLIIVSHRLSTIKSVDEIICMNDGQIVEVGTFNSLLQKQGFFYTLFSEQINHNV